MKIKMLLSLSALIVLATVVLGSTVYISAHPDAYPKLVRGERFFHDR